MSRVDFNIGSSLKRYSCPAIDWAGFFLLGFRFCSVRLLGLVASLIIPMQMSQAGTYTTVQDGNWNSSSTWSGGAPSSNLGGDTVNINHNVTYPNSLGDLYIESGTLNVSSIFTITDVNVKMENSSGRVNVNEGLIIITNNNFENTEGVVTFTDGAAQLCNGNYTVKNSSQTTGDGYIFSKNRNIERLDSGTFSSSIDWCIDNGSGVSLPTSENCTDARPPSGDCTNKSHYLTLNPSITTWDTPISLYATYAGKLNYAVVGNSELKETNGSYNCKNGNSSTATLSLPAGATVKAAYLYWYAMEENDTSDNISFKALSDSVTFNGSAISSTRSNDSAIWFNNGPLTYGGRFADVTSLLSAAPSGNYTVDVTGGASSTACPLWKENARGWSLMVVYEDPSLTAANRIYIYDGMVGFVNSSTSIAVDGYHVPSLRTSGSMTAISIQGDPGISGEYLTTSDTNFPDFGTDFADSTSGAALDIDLLTGDFTANDTSMNLDAGSSGDVILLTNVVLKVPSEMDFGDAPATYGEPIHTIPVTPTLYLGTTAPDDDVASQPAATANWDDNNSTDDEDGVTIPTTDWVINQTETLPIAIQGSGFLNAWIDWNQDGDFDDTDEHIANETAVTTGTTVLSVAVPGTAVGGDHVARFRLCSSAANCNTPTGLADDGEVEDYLIPVSTCTGLIGEVSEVALAIPVQSSAGDTIFFPSSSVSPTEGHLKAHTIQSDGSVDTTSSSWDAATLMDVTKRQNGLYSTDASGSKILFNSLDDAAFAAGASPTVAKIKEYTLDPSIDAGNYLADRKNGSFLGAINRGNDVALITQLLNVSRYLDDATYRAFYTGTIASRSEKVLLSSDDGFLYAFNQTDGQLSWGWMPRALAGELKSYSDFQYNQFMRGKVEVIDAKHSGSYATYVVGGYKDGLGHYVLQLNSSGGLNSVVWDEDRSATHATAVNTGEMDYFQDNAGKTYATYVVTDSSNLSTLIIRNIADASDMIEVSLNFNATSTPYVIVDFERSSAPAAKTLYVGDENGNIRRAGLLNSGSLETSANLKSALEGSTVGALGSVEPIVFLGAAVSALDKEYYLRAQSENRLTVLNYNGSTTNWDKKWTSYVTGAGTWDSVGTFTADASGVPTDTDGDGIATNVSTDGIQSLPADAAITDTATIIGDSIVLPVTTTPANSCIGTAFYYLYSLANGAFPDNKFYNPDRTSIDEDIHLGYGNASRIVVSDMAGQKKRLGHGHADQTPTNDTGVTSFVVNDSVSSGIRGWKEIGRD